MALFDAELSQFHRARPSGVHTHLLDVELTARGMNSFTRDSPSLLPLIKLFALSGTQIWPIPQKRDWPLHSIPVIEAQFGGEDWWKQDVQEARAAQVKRELDRVTAYYKREAEARTAREQADDQEKWKNASGAGK